MHIYIYYICISLSHRLSIYISITHKAFKIISGYQWLNTHLFTWDLNANADLSLNNCHYLILCLAYTARVRGARFALWACTMFTMLSTTTQRNRASAYVIIALWAPRPRDVAPDVVLFALTYIGRKQKKITSSSESLSCAVHIIIILSLGRAQCAESPCPFDNCEQYNKFCVESMIGYRCDRVVCFIEPNIFSMMMATCQMQTCPMSFKQFICLASRSIIIAESPTAPNWYANASTLTITKHDRGQY